MVIKNNRRISIKVTESLGAKYLRLRDWLARNYSMALEEFDDEDKETRGMIYG
jgi:hypothetical protein